MEQQHIRQPGQALAGLVVGDALGLLAAVAAGHDQGAVPILEQEMVQGAVGEHETKGGLAWSDLGRYQGCHLRRPQVCRPGRGYIQGITKTRDC